MAKSRVTPLKTISIPRLELMAAVFSVKVACKLNIELDYSALKLFFWTDSQVVLAYISNESRRFETYVANRVEEIRSKTDVNSWYYITIFIPVRTRQIMPLEVLRPTSYINISHGYKVLNFYGQILVTSL